MTRKKGRIKKNIILYKKQLAIKPKIMKNYYVNNTAQSNRDHEVHTDDCVYLKSIVSKKYLGLFSNCKDAVNEAKKTYSKSNGCKTCCSACHTS